MERKIPFFGKEIKIYQAWFSGELGSTVWDSVSIFNEDNDCKEKLKCHIKN